ncbi:MAG: hypothetical protein ACJAS9_003489 [Polaribacter sp.]|jgi:hypothetical protein
MENQESREWFASVESVIDESLKFKEKLAIGEDAYTSLRLKNTLTEAWDAFGVSATAVTVASSSAVASTFFAPAGILGIFVTATTPIGWVIAAGVLSGGAWMGASRYLKGFSTDKVTVIPKFINTPLDILGLALFDLIAPLALKVANSDGNIANEERDLISNYFVKEWGYNQRFVLEGLLFSESKISDFSIKELAIALAEYKKKNRDCNYRIMTEEIIMFLQELIESDGKIDINEKSAINEISFIFRDVGESFAEKKAKAGWQSIIKVTDSISEKSKKVSMAAGKIVSNGILTKNK